jgi:tetratricopeptide (TPR) repeat protein
MKTMRRALVSLLLAAGVAFAAGQGRLTGKVTDSAGNPVEGVTVTVTTPNLTTFKLTLKTDRKGQYGTILADATMPYHLRFEKEGYQAFEANKKVPVGETGVVDAKLTKTSEAVAAAEKAAPPSAGDQAILAYNAGVDLLSSGDKAGAEGKFQEAVSKNPDLPAGWQALATLAYQKQDWAKTLEHGQKALDLDPSLTQLLGMMTIAAEKSGDKKLAAEWQARYEEANPDTPEIVYNKGIEAYNKGKMKEAEEHLTRAVEANPGFSLAHFWLGMASFNQNKKAAAKEHLQKYLELEPDGKEAATAKEILPLLK